MHIIVICDGLNEAHLIRVGGCCLNIKVRWEIDPN
jgi:hypothetical protein